MSDNFKKIVRKVITNEGGYIIHEVELDRGGRTYAGIAENFWPDWIGWDMLDSGTKENNPNLHDLVDDFYKEEFWDRQNLDLILDSKIAYSIFDFCINGGVRTGGRLAQKTVGVKQDGKIGPISAQAINEMESELFDKQFALEKMYRYAQIVRNDHSQAKFIGGWGNRTEQIEKREI
jgi:lysozyme family protein